MTMGLLKASHQTQEPGPNMTTNETVEELTGMDATKRLAVLGCGYLFFVFGIIGLALPGLPSTVFWIVSAICFSRSSPKMYQRILTLPRVGSAIEDFISYGVIKRRSKTAAVTGMAVMAIIVLLLPMGTMSTFASMAGILIGTVFVLTRPSEAAAEI
jgi:uncharacterized membrane protein YbaN (DUF454 family)